MTDSTNDDALERRRESDRVRQRRYYARGKAAAAKAVLPDDVRAARAFLTIAKHWATLPVEVQHAVTELVQLIEALPPSATERVEE